MAHINYDRQVNIHRTGCLQQIIPMNMGGCNFAVFAGTPHQRNAAAIQAASRFCGYCGIVVLVNASGRTVAPLAQQMLHLPQNLPDSRARFRNIAATILPWSQYDLLYGLDESAIINLIFPSQNTYGHMGQLNPLPGALLTYLKIISYFYQQNPAKFGRSPFNLNLLLELTQMPYTELNKSVLQYLPEPLRSQSQSFLSRPDIQISVATAVQQFTLPFQRHGFAPGAFAAHSRRSIIQAVTNREIICIPIPDSSGVLLDYIEAELAQLSAQNIQYLVISADLDLSKSPVLQRRFLASCTGQYYVGILAESASGIADTDVDQTRLFSNYQQILVFQCASTDVAEPFSHNLGTYQRRDYQHHFGRHWSLFRLFPDHEEGVGEVLTEERNVRPDELTELENGVLLCGKHYPHPTLIDNLIF